MARQPPTAIVSPSAMPLISRPALLQAYLSQSPPTRPSNRTPSQVRPINLNAGSLTHCNGSSLVRLGESTVVCGIRAELLPVSEIPHFRASETARAAQDKPKDETYEAVTLNHLLVPNLELSTNCHPSFPPKVAPTVTAQSISQRVLSLLHSSRIVPISDLEIRYTSDAADTSSGLDPDDPAYIEPERDVLKAYWTLYIDCVALSYGGEANIFDTTVLAVVAALKDIRLPQARWDEDSKMIFCNADFSKARMLQLTCIPCPLSFGVFEADPRLKFGDAKETNGISQEQKAVTTVLLDLDSFEDDVCDEKGNIVVDCSSGKCQILKLEKVGGSGRLTVEEMKDIARSAEQRWTDWKRILDAVG